jgi:imidazoleglycerol-phosphate dehydratase
MPPWEGRYMQRISEIARTTKETDIKLRLTVDGKGQSQISTRIPFLDHMLTLFAAHGLFDLIIEATGDLEVDFHHTVEDVGLVLGDALDQALADRKGILRYGHAVVPMDESLTAVTVDLSKRPYLVFNCPEIAMQQGSAFDIPLSKEFFRAFATRGGLNLHINTFYGENQHHILESIFKALARALDQATLLSQRFEGVRSTKGVL